MAASCGYLLVPRGRCSLESPAGRAASQVARPEPAEADVQVGRRCGFGQRAVVRDRKGRFVRTSRGKDFVVARSGPSGATSRLPGRAMARELALLVRRQRQHASGDRRSRTRGRRRATCSARCVWTTAERRSGGVQLRHEPAVAAAVHVGRGALEARWRASMPFGQTSLYDAIAQTARARAPKRRPGDRRRRARRRAHRRHRHAQPDDARAGVGASRAHRRAGLHHRCRLAARPSE